MSEYGDQQPPGQTPPPPYSPQQPYQQPYQQQPYAGYGQDPYAQPGYTAPAYGGMPGAYPGYAVQDHPKATTALILGLVAVVGGFLCGVLALVGPFAWVVGARAVREIDAEPGRWGGRGQAQAGMWLGIVSTVLLVLGVLAVAAFVIIALVGSS